MTKRPIRTLAGLLGCLSALACVGGCIPIGVKGSTMAAIEPRSCVAQARLTSHLAAQLTAASTTPLRDVAPHPVAESDAPREHDTPAASRCT